MWHKNLSPKQQQGRLWEQRALTYLGMRGLTLVEANYTCRGGEIDLIMRDNGTLVFVEVRQRDNTGYGGAAASISPAKVRRLVRAAQTYLLRFTRLPPCRFDVLAVDGDKIDWLRNVIEV
ncbi:MAG TPA: YraN family protein [Telluria sp.]|nr:YraN family protein [Telluria sp.]